MKIKTTYLAAGYLLGIGTLIASLIWFRFVWLTSQSVQAFTSTAASFQSSHLFEELILPRPLGKALVLHFVDEACPCTKYSTPYIAELEQETGEFVAHLHSSEPSGVDGENMKVIELMLRTVPASPAVAIWDADGRLSYFGPYSNGEYCGDGEDMARYVLKSIAAGEKIAWLDQESQGCMCPWPQPPAAKR